MFKKEETVQTEVKIPPKGYVFSCSNSRRHLVQKEEVK